MKAWSRRWNCWKATPGQIALLVTGRRHAMQKEALDFHGWEGYWDEFFAGEEVFYGHVLGFKGLERPVVVLAVNGIRDVARGREYLYVGLSGARTCLVVCGDLNHITALGGGGLCRRLQAPPRAGRDLRQSPPLRPVG